MKTRAAAPETLSVVAVVDARDGAVAIWWVDVAEAPAINRLCGAWTIQSADADILKRLLHNRHVLATPDGAELLDALGVSAGQRADAALMHAVLAATVEDVQARHDSHIASGKKAPAPVWPILPAALDMGAQTSLSAQALGIATWLVAVCSAWSQIESQRASKAHLRGPEGGVRDLPIASA